MEGPVSLWAYVTPRGADNLRSRASFLAQQHAHSNEEALHTSHNSSSMNNSNLAFPRSWQKALAKHADALLPTAATSPALSCASLAAVTCAALIAFLSSSNALFHDSSDESIVSLGGLSRAPALTVALLLALGLACRSAAVLRETEGSSADSSVHSTTGIDRCPPALAVMCRWGCAIVSLPSFSLLLGALLHLHPVLLFVLHSVFTLLVHAFLWHVYFTKSLPPVGFTGMDVEATHVIFWLLTALFPNWASATGDVSIIGTLHLSRWIFTAILVFACYIFYRTVSSGRSLLLLSASQLRPALMHTIPTTVVVSLMTVWVADAGALLMNHSASVIMTFGAIFSVIALRILLQIVSCDQTFKTFYTIMLGLAVATALSFVSDIVFAASNFSDELLLYAMQGLSFANMAIVGVIGVSEISTNVGFIPFQMPPFPRLPGFVQSTGASGVV